MSLMSVSPLMTLLQELYTFVNNIHLQYVQRKAKPDILLVYESNFYTIIYAMCFSRDYQ